MTPHDLLHPISVDAFATDYLGRSMLHREGPAGRFHHILPWNELNNALATTRYGEGRIQFFKDGRAVPPALFVQSTNMAAQHLLKPGAVEHHLANGATLVFNSIDEVIPDIRGLAAAFEDLLDIRVNINLYAGVSRHGFDIHWDSHDTLILQVYGQKAWRVYRPTVVHPLGRCRAEQARPSDDTIVWDRVLTAGSILYMPRGWWHQARPCNHLSVHLTMGLNRPTPLDFLTWIKRRLADLESLRGDIALNAGHGGGDAWLGELRGALAKHITAEAVETFRTYARSRVPVRVVPVLPNVDADVRPILLSGSERVYLKRERLLLIEHHRDGDKLGFSSGGTQWMCPNAFAKALGRLKHQPAARVSDLCALVPSTSARDLRLFLMALHAGGVIAVEEPAHDAVLV